MLLSIRLLHKITQKGYVPSHTVCSVASDDGKEHKWEQHQTPPGKNILDWKTCTTLDFVVTISPVNLLHGGAIPIASLQLLAIANLARLLSTVPHDQQDEAVLVKSTGHLEVEPPLSPASYHCHQKVYH